MDDDYTIVSYNGHDIKIREYDDHIYMETELYQMGEAVKIGQCYNIKRDDYTGNEYDDKIKKTMGDFLNFYENCK